MDLGWVHWLTGSQVLGLGVVNELLEAVLNVLLSLIKLVDLLLRRVEKVFQLLIVL